MKFEYCTGEMNSTEPKDAARTIYDFFTYQLRRSVEEDISARAQLSAANAANAGAEDEARRDPDIGLGFGIPLPYSESDLAKLTAETTRTEKQRREAKALLDFVVNRLIIGFVDAPKRSI